MANLFVTNAGTTAAANNADVAPGIPAGTIAGDLMIALVSARSSTASFSTPAGWTFVADFANSGGANRAFVFYRFWVTGDAAPTFVLSGGASNVTTLGCIAGIRGGTAITTTSIDKNYPIAQAGSASGSGAGTETTTIPYSAFTKVGRAGSLALMLWHRADDAGTISYSGPFTNGATDHFGVSSTLGSDARQGGGEISPGVDATSGSVSITSGAAATRESFWIEINPAVPRNSAINHQNPAVFMEGEMEQDKRNHLWLPKRKRLWRPRIELPAPLYA